ncbi:MAG: histidine phosphatase family protein [Gammaproteobacteria bacterium]|jgi:probable phosphoglycerate mutase
MTDTRIDFLRHGEPVGGRRYRGDGVDDPLSETGWQQMWDAVGDAAPWSRIVSSPLQRCRAFARALSERQRLPLSVEARFREVGLGAWEGLSPDDILRDEPDAYAAFYRDPSRNRPRGAEPLEAFGARVASALEELFAGFAGEHLLVVAHAGVIRAVLGHVLQSEPAAWYRTRIDNAGLTRVRRGRYGARLEFHNRRTLG